MGLSQELLLIGHDLRESVRRDLAPVLLREAGGHVLVEQCDRVIEIGRKFGRRVILYAQCR